MNETIVYLIGLAATIFGVFGTVVAVVYNKRKEFELHQKAIKEEKYAQFLESLILVLNSKKNNQKNDEALNDLMKSIELIYIIGTPEVINKMNELIELANGENKVKTIKDSQDVLYANLVKEIRKDLGNSSKGEKFPDELKIWTFS